MTPICQRRAGRAGADREPCCSARVARALRVWLASDDAGVNEKRRAESLVLSGCPQIGVIRQMTQKGSHFAFFHLGRMAFCVKENPSPSDIGLFRMNAISASGGSFPGPGPGASLCQEHNVWALRGS
jgi:hypothetical protein